MKRIRDLRKEVRKEVFCMEAANYSVIVGL